METTVSQRSASHKSSWLVEDQIGYIVRYLDLQAEPKTVHSHKPNIDPVET